MKKRDATAVPKRAEPLSIPSYLTPKQKLAKGTDIYLKMITSKPTVGVYGGPKTKPKGK